MLAILHRPELATPELWDWLQQYVAYDVDGRCSRWLDLASLELASLARAMCPGMDFASVLLQGYRDGRAVTPCHTDQGGTGFSFILSLGAPRTFRIHRVSTLCDSVDVVTVECVSGMVLMMDGDFQNNWHHQVIPDLEVTEERLSLSYRTRPGRG